MDKGVEYAKEGEYEKAIGINPYYANCHVSRELNRRGKPRADFKKAFNGGIEDAYRRAYEELSDD